MKTYISVSILCIVWFSGCAILESPAGKSLTGEKELSEKTIIKGLKEALSVGSQKAVDKLSLPGGYGKNPSLRIPIPKKLEDVASKLRKIGLEDEVEKFADTMNEAAEHAATQAVPIFIDAIKQMTFEDARRILKGHKKAATEYFKEKTTTGLKKVYLPVVKKHMESVGVVKRYTKLINKYNSIPFTKKIEFSIDVYITDEALKGLFIVLGHVEEDIRTNPAARTTELLRKVFRK